MERFQKGDATAFEVLVHKYQAPVLSLVRRYLGSRSSGVEDVAQEVFLRIYRARDTYEPRAKVGTWIYRITVNTCLNEIRRLRADKNRRIAGFSAVFEDESAADAALEDVSAAAPLDRVEASETQESLRDAVARAVDALPEQQRLAVVLSRWHGLGYEEVAAALGTTVPAVKSLLTRARDHLRASLSSYAGSFSRYATSSSPLSPPTQGAPQTAPGRSADMSQRPSRDTEVGSTAPSTSSDISLRLSPPTQGAPKTAPGRSADMSPRPSPLTQGAPQTAPGRPADRSQRPSGDTETGMPPRDSDTSARPARDAETGTVRE
jgi:RNA polymerase sigma-70 factor (ECF subfamily)